MPEHCGHAIVRQQGEVTLVELTRSDLIDHDVVDVLAADLTAYVERLDRPFIVLSLLQVQFISSYTVGMLIALLKMIESKGGALDLADPGLNIRDVFELARLTDIMPLFETSKEALAAMRTRAEAA